MRTCDNDILAGKPRQQPLASRSSGRLVNVEDCGDFGMFQLNTRRMESVAPEQDLLALRGKLIAHVPRRVSRQRDNLHPVRDCLGAAERMPLASLDVGRCNGLRALEK